MATMRRYLAGGVCLIVAIFVSGLAWAADPFPSSSCAGLSAFELVQCNGVVAVSAQLAALQTSMDGVSGLAGTLSTPLSAISSFWNEELLYFFLGVGLAMVFVRAVGTRW